MKTNNHNHITWMLSAFSCVVMTVAGCYDDTQLREQVNNQQAELEAALQELRAADAELDGLVSAVAARVTELEATVEGIETSVGNLGTDVDNLETEVGGVKTDLGELENSINALLERVSQLENRVPDTGNTGEGGVGETSGNYAEQIAAMQKELADLKSAVQSSRDMYSKLESNMTGLQEMLNMHDWDLNQVKQRLESCEAFMAEFNDFKTWVQTELDLIKADIESIKQSLLELIAVDADLNGLISALSARVEQLEAEIAALKNAESGDNGGTVTPPDNSQVEDLEARVAALEQELAAINTALESLRTKDGELEEAINALAAIVASNKAEAEASFANLAEFNALKEAVEALEDEYAAEFGLIKSDINTIKETLTSLEDADETLEGLIAALQERAAEIEKSIETLEQSVTDDIDALNAKIAELNTVLTAVNTAIAELKAKDSETDAAIASLRAALEAHEAAVEQTLAEYLADVQGISDEFTALLNQHIQSSQTAFTQQTEAINALAEEIAAMKEHYEAEFDLIKKDIADIVAMIQSMTPISKYSDGCASAAYFCDDNESENLAIVECNYIVRPAGAAERLAQAWAENKDLMQFRAHYTQTRASFDFVDMEVKKVSAADDILTVTGYVDGISDAWIMGNQAFSVSLLVTDGKTDYCTDFVNVLPEEQYTDLSRDGTANCYIVIEPGEYRFKAVKGNSDTPVGTQSSSYIGLSDPIGTPHSAEVLWELSRSETSPGHIIEPDYEYRNGYVYFSCPNRTDIYCVGSAVLAVKDADGKILWSWHIWRLSDWPTSESYNMGDGTYRIMMQYNLGAFYNSSSNASGYGLLYQWGRKDPIVPREVDKSKVSTTWPEDVKSDAETGTMEYATSHPMTFIKGNDNNKDWCYSDYATIRTSRWGKTKTIYDPCPPGWRVPDPDIWATAAASDKFTGVYDSSSYSVDCSSFGTDVKYQILSYWDENGDGYPNHTDGYYWGCGQLTGEPTANNGYPVLIALRLSRASTNTTAVDINTKELVYASYGCSVRCQSE